MANPLVAAPACSISCYGYKPPSCTSCSGNIFIPLSSINSRACLCISKSMSCSSNRPFVGQLHTTFYSLRHKFLRGTHCGFLNLPARTGKKAGFESSPLKWNLMDQDRPDTESNSTLRPKHGSNSCLDKDNNIVVIHHDEAQVTLKFLKIRFIFITNMNK